MHQHFCLSVVAPNKQRSNHGPLAFLGGAQRNIVKLAYEYQYGKSLANAKITNLQLKCACVIEGFASFNCFDTISHISFAPGILAIASPSAWCILLRSQFPFGAFM